MLSRSKLYTNLVLSVYFISKIQLRLRGMNLYHGHNTLSYGPSPVIEEKGEEEEEEKK